MLKSNPNEYLAKAIGCVRKTIDISKTNDKVYFLLDGQQRLTVLSNVFSNIIHNQYDSINELASPSLKRRFFLKICNWEDAKTGKDIFGVYNLSFDYLNPESEEPSFLSGDVLDLIECRSFLVNDDSPYNPKKKVGIGLDKFCVSNKDGYLIPLFLLAPASEEKQMNSKLDTIVKKISESIKDEILDYFNSIDGEEKKEFIEKVLCSDPDLEECKNDFRKFEEKIEERSNEWKIGIMNYLNASVTIVSLNKIVVEEEQRERAIDIYENLNMGGVSLNTFDLVMAKVAKVSKENYYSRIITDMKKEREYNCDYLPDAIKGIFCDYKRKNGYNATIQMGAINEGKNEISSKYIDVFLDVMSLYCYNKKYNVNDYKVEHIKRGKILELSPNEINNNTEKVCEAIDKALFFLNTRCGLRNIKEINYSLMLVIIALIFMNDKYYNKRTNDILEAWYWACVFSGQFDKDQNTMMISNLQQLVKILNNEKDNTWIKNIGDSVFSTQYFSEKGFILMEKTSQERYPKSILKSFICQYYLSKTYSDMFDNNMKISAFCEKADSLEAHHIVPLGSAKKIGESTTTLRKQNGHICNSPVNFVYITKEANKEISSESLPEYIKKVNDSAKSKLHITSFNGDFECTDLNSVKSFLSNRFDSIRGDVMDRINMLLQYC